MFSTKIYSFLRKSFFLKDKIILINLLISTVILFTLLFLFIIRIPTFKSSGDLLLHYNIYSGIDWMGSWYKIYLYPLIGILLFALNLVLGIFFYSREKFLSYLLIISITFCEILTFIACLSVLWINS